MSKNLLKFLIIVKAKRRNGVYIALDMEQGKFIKPALRESTSTWLSKDPDLQIGEEHLFEKSRDPLEISHPYGGGPTWRILMASAFTNTLVARLLVFTDAKENT